MVLLLIILGNEDHLEELLEAFLEIGITGASVLSARGMGEILSRNVPIFAGLRGLFPGGECEHRLVLSVAEREKAREAVSILERMSGSLDARGAGIAFTLPIEEVWGLAEEI